MELDDGRVTFGDPAPEAHTVVKDPVCGKEMARADAAAAVDYHGTLYYFCSLEHKRRFTEAPETFVSRAEP